MSAAESNALVNTLKASASCTNAADKTWQLGGDGNGGADTPGQTRQSVHTSHYNRGLNRCLMLVTTTLTNTTSNSVSLLQEVFDVGQRPARPFASLRTDGAAKTLMKEEAGTLAKAPTTPENLAWFQRLMLD